MLNDVTQGEARIDFSFISTSLVLHPTNQISAKKHVRELMVLYRVRKSFGIYQSLHLQKAYVCFLTYGKSVTKATKHNKASVRTRRWQNK